jgi:hypothetical protein
MHEGKQVVGVIIISVAALTTVKELIIVAILI